MNKTQQSAYHNIFQGFQNMADEILIPRLEPEELYNVFFQLRLDHPISLQILSGFSEPDLCAGIPV